MLRETFVHLPGIGETVERKLWRQGCLCWDDFLDRPKRYSVGSASREVVRRELKTSSEALAQGQHQYFRKRLRQKHAWRAYEAFKETTVFLDIETDGSTGSEAITMIGMHDVNGFQALVKGIDLENFRDAISRYSVIVTFYGTGFDLPVINRRFPDIRLDQIHIDLHPLLRKLGYRGGLKRIEAEFGLVRDQSTQGLTGRDAIFLWRKYLRGDDASLERLIAYNREDVVNLEPLMDAAFAKMRDKAISCRQALLPGLAEVD